MSQMLSLAAILDYLKQDCIDAWGLTNASVDFGQKRIPANASPYAIIDLMPVDMGALAARTVYQNFTFRITGRFPFPSSGNILLEKIAKANLLIAEIITGSDYHGLAHLPYVTEFDPTEQDEPQAKVYEFSITVTMQVEVDHH